MKGDQSDTQRRFCLAMMRAERRVEAEAGGRGDLVHALAVRAVAAASRRKGLCRGCPGCRAETAEAARDAADPQSADRAASASPWASPPAVPRLRQAPPRLASAARARRAQGG